MAIAYQAAGTNAGVTGWGTVAQAKIYAASDPTTILAQLTFGSGGTITDLAGRVYICNGCGISMGAFLETTQGNLTLPGESAPTRQVAPLMTSYGNLLVSSITNDGVSYTYSYANIRAGTAGNSLLYDTVHVVGPNGCDKTFGFQPSLTGAMNINTYVIDELSRRTVIQVNSTTGMITKITRPEGDSDEYSYTNGMVSQETHHSKPGSGLADIIETVHYVTSCSGVLCYRPDYYIDGRSSQTDYQYNASGQLTQKLEPADRAGVRRVTYITYDSTGPVSRARIIRTCGLTTTCGTTSEIRTEYDYWGNTFLPSVERRIDAASGVTLTTQYFYDNAGRLIQVVNPNGVSRYYRYDVEGRKTWDITGPSPTGMRIVNASYYRDSDDKIVATETGTVTSPTATSYTPISRVDTAFDGHRNPVRDTASSGGTIYVITDRSFNDRGQLGCETVRMNPSAPPAVGSDACTLGTMGSQGADLISKNIYDAAGQLIQIRRAVGTSLEQAYATYSFTPDGKEQDVIDANGNHAKLTYDGFDRRGGWYFSSPTAPSAFDGSTQGSALATAGAVSTTDYETYSYDANGNITSRRLRNGGQIIYAFDALNRLINKTLPTGNPNLNSVYGYDVMGHLSTMTSSNAVYSTTTSYTYDGFGRATSEAESLNGGAIHTITSNYDPDGNRIKFSWSDAPFYITYQYDGMDRMTAINEGDTTNLVSFVYDSAGRRQTLTRANGTSTVYGYDGLSRLTDLQLKTGGTIANEYSFNYTPANQISQRTMSNTSFTWTGAVSVNRNYMVNGLNQYSGITSISAPTYDPKGNLTSAGGSTYSYNAENELATQDSYRFYYDPNHRLIFDTQSGTQLLYDGDRLIAEYNRAGTPLRRYVFGPNPDEPLIWYEGTGTTAKSWMAADAQGSIVLVTNGTGATLAVDSYDEYGIPATTNTIYAGRFRYTGQQWNTYLGMYYYKARIYSPTLGRFLQTDPVGYGDQLNLYTYVANDPMNRSDPAGLYNCSANDCKTIEKYAQALRQAANTPKTGTRIADSALKAAAKFVGTMNDGNKVDISLGNINGAADGNTGLSDGRASITLDSSKIGNDSRYGAVVLGHESVHGAQFLTRGQPSSLADVDRRERAAYRVGSYISERLGVESRVWSPGMTEAQRNAAVDAGAHDSCVNASIGTGPLYKEPFSGQNCP